MAYRDPDELSDEEREELGLPVETYRGPENINPDDWEPVEAEWGEVAAIIETHVGREELRMLKELAQFYGTSLGDTLKIALYRMYQQFKDR